MSFLVDIKIVNRTLVDVKKWEIRPGGCEIVHKGPRPFKIPAQNGAVTAKFLFMTISQKINLLVIILYFANGTQRSIMARYDRSKPPSQCFVYEKGVGSFYSEVVHKGDKKTVYDIVYLYNSTNDLLNNPAVLLNEKGEEELKKGNFDQARALFRQAFSKARIQATRLLAKRNNARSEFEIGARRMRLAMEAEKAETEQRCAHAQKFFTEAKWAFEAAYNLDKVSKYWQHVSMARSLIGGNKTFNEGAELELKSYKVADIPQRAKMLHEALKKYESAAKTFESQVKAYGQYFQDRLNFARKQIAAVQLVFNRLACGHLAHMVGNLDLQDDEDDEDANIFAQLMF